MNAGTSGWPLLSRERHAQNAEVTIIMSLKQRKNASNIHQGRARISGSDGN